MRELGEINVSWMTSQQALEEVAVLAELGGGLAAAWWNLGSTRTSGTGRPLHT
jgi:hypothetical protein